MRLYCSKIQNKYKVSKYYGSINILPIKRSVGTRYLKMFSVFYNIRCKNVIGVHLYYRCTIIEIHYLYLLFKY